MFGGSSLPNDMILDLDYSFVFLLLVSLYLNSETDIISLFFHKTQLKVKRVQ